jgi:hypothetical protein
MKSLVSVGLVLVVVGLVPNGLLVDEAGAQEFSRLGLSAAPDAYVASLETEIDQPFTLYVIVTGLAGQEPLPFDLYEVDWTVFTACCGDSPVLITGMDYPEETMHEGDPYDFVKSTAVDCLEDDVVMLASITFDWSEEFAGMTTFPVSAGASGPAQDCTSDYHVLMGLYVDVIGTPVQTDNEAVTWGGLKAGYGN